MPDTEKPPRYAVCCRNCGHIEDKAWQAETETEHSKRTEKPLTPQGRVPRCCLKCGQQQWDKPASREQIEAFDERIRKEARAVELTRHDDFDGMFKIPDEFKAAPEVKRAVGNLLAGLEGETLKAAVSNIMKVARSGMAADALTWIDYYDRAVQKAVAGARKSA